MCDGRDGVLHTASAFKNIDTIVTTVTGAEKKARTATGIAKGRSALCPSESACTFDSNCSGTEIAVKGIVALLSARK